jgi:hypothetical protein
MKVHLGGSGESDEMTGKWVCKQGFELGPSEHKQAPWSARILTRFSIVFLSLFREISGLTHSPCGQVLLEKLTGSQLIKKFPALYGTRRFITAFTIAHHPSLSQSSPCPPITLPEDPS